MVFLNTSGQKANTPIFDDYKFLSIKQLVIRHWNLYDWSRSVWVFRLPGVNFYYDFRSAKSIEIALSKNNFAVRHSPNYCATKRCEKLRRLANPLYFPIEKSTPGGLYSFNLHNSSQSSIHKYDT